MPLYFACFVSMYICYLLYWSLLYLYFHISAFVDTHKRIQRCFLDLVQLSLVLLYTLRP